MKPQNRESHFEKGFTLQSYQIIRVSGSDACDFLQRVTSQDFKGIERESFPTPGAFLTATGTVIGTFWVKMDNNDFLLAVQNSSVERVLQQIEKMHFGENLEYKVDLNWKAIEVLTASVAHSAPTYQGRGYEISIGENEQILTLRSHLILEGAKEWSDEEWRRQKTLQFQPLDQIDLTENNIILEAGLFDFVHRNKGCYPGQEVIERIYTYGNIPRKFVHLRGLGILDGKSGLSIEGQSVGRITSHFQLDGTFVANAYLLRGRAQINADVDVVTIDGEKASAQVVGVSQDLDKTNGV